LDLHWMDPDQGANDGEWQLVLGAVDGQYSHLLFWADLLRKLGKRSRN
jgi:hypothetical protein